MVAKLLARLKEAVKTITFLVFIIAILVVLGLELINKVGGKDGD